MNLRILPIFLTLILLTTGAFGLLGLSSAGHGGEGGCLISVLSGGNCPPAGDSLSSTLHHLSGLQYLTQSIVGAGSGLLATLALMILSPLLSILIKSLHRAPSGQALSRQKHREVLNFSIRPERRFLRWLALRSKLDLNAFCRVRGIT
ncbi:MAG: hypothetical protein BMS9Abin13_194 [Patescibacteria group bacterium]|nr:MAG: hypothetical protein BMS9Abin13_194 [Patescibacteria group bacterium]